MEWVTISDEAMLEGLLKAGMNTAMARGYVEPDIDHKAYNVEEMLFEKHLHREYHVEIMEDLPGDFSEFEKRYENLEILPVTYRTDKAGYPFLRYLAHSYYRNELLPEEWRVYFLERDRTPA